MITFNGSPEVGKEIRCKASLRFGLQAGIYTGDIQKAMKASDQLEVDGVMINDIPTFRVDHMPYGGVKESGTGREGIRYSVKEMTEMKFVMVNNN